MQIPIKLTFLDVVSRIHTVAKSVDSGARFIFFVVNSVSDFILLCEMVNSIRHQTVNFIGIFARPPFVQFIHHMH